MHSSRPNRQESLSVAMTQFKEPEAMASLLAGYDVNQSYADAVSAVGSRMMKTATVSVF